MAVKVVRFYSTDNEDLEDLEDMWMSIVADDSTVKYVFPPDAEVSGLDDDRIASLVAAFNDGQDPTTAEDWVDLASMRVSGTVYDGPEYDSVDAAISGEVEVLKEAFELRKGFTDPDYLAEVFETTDVETGDSDE